MPRRQIIRKVVIPATAFGARLCLGQERLVRFVLDLDREIAGVPAHFRVVGGPVIAFRLGRKIGPSWDDAVGVLDVGFSVLDEHGHGHFPESVLLHGLRLELFRVVQSGAFVLVAPILEPDLHLGARELETLGQHFALWGAEVSLLLEALFQLEDLGLENYKRFLGNGLGENKG